jgi:hypothetical protein
MRNSFRKYFHKISLRNSHKIHYDAGTVFMLGCISILLSLQRVANFITKMKPSKFSQKIKWEVKRKLFLSHSAHTLSHLSCHERRDKKQNYYNNFYNEIIEKRKKLNSSQDFLCGCFCWTVFSSRKFICLFMHPN